MWNRILKEDQKKKKKKGGREVGMNVLMREFLTQYDKECYHC